MNTNIERLIKENTENILGMDIVDHEALAQAVAQEAIAVCASRLAASVHTSAAPHNQAINGCINSLNTHFGIE